MDTTAIRRETLILSAAVVFLSDPLLLELFSLMHLPKLAGLGLTRLIQTATVLGLVVYFQKSLESIGLAGSAFWKSILKGCIWSGGTGLVTAAGFALLYFSGINPLALFGTSRHFSPMDTVMYYIAGGLIAPIAEEVFFRGVLFGFLRTWGFPFALVVSTAIFAAFHTLFSGQTLPITQIAGGLLFALSYEKEKTLWVPIVIHATGNIAIFTLSLI